MKSLRRFVLFLLLLTVPFHTAIGATGYVCGHGAHHAVQTAKAAGTEHLASHHRPTSLAQADAGLHSVQHAHLHQNASTSGSPATNAVDTVLSTPQSGETGAAGTCEFCSECSFSLAPASQTSPNALRHASPLRVSFYVDPTAFSHVGDALFRPPRSILS
jgi:hypothetical protein